MPSLCGTNQKKLGFLSDNLVGTLCKTLAMAGLAFCFFSIFLFNHPTCQNEIFSPLKRSWFSAEQSNPNDSPTNISHIVFGIIGSVNAWKYRKPYIDSWWLPNVTRGYLFLDTAPSEDLLPWPSSSPPFRVSEDNQKSILDYTKHDATMVRIARGILETFQEGDQDVRWYIMGDDDSIFFLENMVDVLSKYDHTKYIYMGGHTESISQAQVHAFDMGFGGAGVIFSQALAATLVPMLDDCIRRYAVVHAADQMWASCLADIGVYMIHAKGIHQIDLHNDISGLLSSHPPAPLLSLHHPEKVDPLFPNMDRNQSVHHLLKAAKVDQSRLVQQTICYNRNTNWSFSISWGYSAHIYENIYPKSILQKPIETFRPWRKLNPRPPFFVFNTRVLSRDPCWDPHVFFFESVKSDGDGDEIITTYARSAPRELGACSLTGNHSADYISTIRVLSPKTNIIEDNRRECCDVVLVDHVNTTAEVNYRACEKDEVIG